MNLSVSTGGTLLPASECDNVLTLHSTDPNCPTQLRASACAAFQNPTDPSRNPFGTPIDRPSFRLQKVLPGPMRPTYMSTTSFGCPSVIFARMASDRNLGWNISVSTALCHTSILCPRQPFKASSVCKVQRPMFCPMLVGGMATCSIMQGLAQVKR